jgi:3-hydroxybutyrate dehydrogenase
MQTPALSSICQGSIPRRLDKIERAPTGLRDKVCIVTGAASGIGRTIASAFAKEGGKVVIADLNQQAAQSAVDEINADGGHATPIELDVAAEAQVDRAVASVAARFGTVDVLVNNAGIQIVHPIEDFPLAD